MLDEVHCTPAPDTVLDILSVNISARAAWFQKMIFLHSKSVDERYEQVRGTKRPPPQAAFNLKFKRRVPVHGASLIFNRASTYL